jgi:hypothetical protein
MWCQSEELVELYSAPFVCSDGLEREKFTFIN